MRAITHLVLAAMTAAMLTAAGHASQIPLRPDDKIILHVLNRTGFGARPGDLERVRTQGLASYIEGQLRPDRIDDSGMDRRLASLDTLRMSSRELASEYFQPAATARRRRAAANPAPDGM